MNEQSLEIVVGRPHSESPAWAYISTLTSSSSKQTMTYALTSIINLVVPDEKIDLMDFPWEHLQYHHCLQIRELLAAKYELATANLYLSALRGVVRAGWKLGYYTIDDCERRLSFPPIPGSDVPTGRSLTKEELRKLFDVCENDSRLWGRRDAAILAVFYSTGVRRSELVNITIDDLEKIDRGYRVSIRRGKGNKHRYAFINLFAAAKLETWLNHRSSEPGFLFNPVLETGIDHSSSFRFPPLVSQSVYDILRSRSSQAGIEQVTPHDLRRTCITHLLEAKVDIFTIQKIAGHSLVQTTRRYDRRVDESLVDAVDVLKISQ